MKRVGCLGLLLGLALVMALFTLVQTWSGAGPLAAARNVVVPQGATLTRAAEEMERAGAITSARRFVLLSKLLGGSDTIRAGEYAVPAGISQADLLTLMQEGKVVQRLVAVPEGLPSVLVHEALMRAPGLTGDVAVPEEGSVLPDSYSYERGETRAEVLARMQTAMDRYLADAWKRRKPGLVVNTPREAVILASIVEKETAREAERRTVAAVYSNRLRQGMRLQADPTIIYPLTRGRPLGRRILRSEVRAVNGYNTYSMAGLPQGPIANPGRASIDAVLDPADTSALYFVADGTGGHVFADTLEQHNANVAKWYAIRRARGEM
ncbi:endolytic transglycosylase MltG [Sphingomonas sp.]|uniref:endolytic transglycosylase MltG n=1 Tax=Sphingomonas sp. TaxID=28214 RepID=UPI002C80ED7F|nr:endolytic transglycosylase MltG [Sphingomonas sp.]HTG38352.1 endolytic transglycosylase MltG [Sphingomonas sp.]